MFRRSYINDLIDRLVRILNGGKRNLAFYTDSSLMLREESSPDIAQIGFSWVLVDLVKNIVIDDCGKTSLWPFSTKPELLAIWSALLVCPKESVVTIFTDSLAAINKKYQSVSEETAWNILTSEAKAELDHPQFLGSSSEEIEIADYRDIKAAITAILQGYWNHFYEDIWKKR
ncbi:7946_t:CDS:2, partial [Gigaspora margarita]